MENKEKLEKTRNLIFNYFYNKKFYAFLIFIGTYIIMKLLYLLENWHWLDAASLILPIVIFVGLIIFYIGAKKHRIIGLEFVIFGLNLTLIVLTFAVTIIIFLSIPSMFEATFAFVIFGLFVLAIVIYTQAIYYASRSLSIIKNFILNGSLKSEFRQAFSKVSIRFVISGIIFIFVYLLSIFNEDAINTINKINYYEIVLLGDFNILNKTLLTIIGFVLPFIIALIFYNIKNAIENIYEISKNE